MIKDVTYIINTHSRYILPLENLLESMSYIPKDRIIVVCAESGKDEVLIFDNGMRVVFEYHNSFDYTGAISLLQRDLKTAPYIFFLQDTMEFGMNTDYFIKKAPTNVPCVAAFGGQCNLVLYKRDYLEHHKDWILQRENMSKLDSIHHEGKLWHMSSELASFPNSTMQVLGSGNPYGGAERIKEYYDAIDLIKWKANYGQNMHNMIVHP